ncbi:hypothetical protein E7T06_17645 [Deinococcus sp. Arct2-2]|uniref:hypothetical protein n=1 Tax=Deinococcus sp. Arct2-2 TaxID=2568653 RepID=UPI0010A49FFF|nr:hypothetical protein [Deinococcus sp. Arct2-2]THF68160.1 hypothetical protein E7T06_17645 [Deinococcus sp. Arct2-2]
MNDLWDVLFTQESDQEGLCSVRSPVLLETVKHETVLVHGPPESVSDAAELDIPLAERLVAYVETALVQQFLDVRGA